MPISGYCIDGQWISRHEDPVVQTYRDPRGRGKFKVTARGLRLWRCAWCRLWAGNRTHWCGGCKIVSYCSEDCQRGHWADAHRYDCEDVSDIQGVDVLREDELREDDVEFRAHVTEVLEFLANVRNT